MCSSNVTLFYCTIGWILYDYFILYNMINKTYRVVIEGQEIGTPKRIHHTFKFNTKVYKIIAKIVSKQFKKTRNIKFNIF